MLYKLLLLLSSLKSQKHNCFFLHLLQKSRDASGILCNSIPIICIFSHFPISVVFFFYNLQKFASQKERKEIVFFKCFVRVFFLLNHCACLFVFYLSLSLNFVIVKYIPTQLPSSILSVNLNAHYFFFFKIKNKKKSVWPVFSVILYLNSFKRVVWLLIKVVSWAAQSLSLDRWQRVIKERERN